MRVSQDSCIGGLQSQGKARVHTCLVHPVHTHSPRCWVDYSESSVQYTNSHLNFLTARHKHRQSVCNTCTFVSDWPHRCLVQINKLIVSTTGLATVSRPRTTQISVQPVRSRQAPNHQHFQEAGSQPALKSSFKRLFVMREKHRPGTDIGPGGRRWLRRCRRGRATNCHAPSAARD